MLPQFDDPFDFFRFTLWVIVTIYCTIIMAQSIYNWVGLLSGHEKYVSMIRRYILVQALRLRFKTFWGDLLICLLLCGVFYLLWRLHELIQPVT